MKMKMNVIKDLILISIILVLVDLINLIFFASHIFNPQIQLVQNSPLKVNILGAILSYITIIFGLYYFIIKDHRNIYDAFLFGIVTYGIFETTNLAIFKNWSLVTTFVDTLWGGILFALTTYVVYFIKNKLKYF